MTKQQEKLSVEAIAHMADLEPHEVISAVMRELGKRSKMSTEQARENGTKGSGKRWGK